MVGLCVVVPGLALAATGNTSVAIVWTELGLFASPVAFAVPGWRWGVPIWLCGVASLYVLGSAVLCLVSAVFVWSLGAMIVLGLLAAALAGTLALVGCARSESSPVSFVVLELLAAAALAGAIALIASDSGIHHVEVGSATDLSVSHTDLGGLYSLWAAAAVMILAGVAVSLVATRRQIA